MQEVIDLGFEDLLDPSGIMFVEWGDAIEELLPESFVEARLTVQDDEVRSIRVRGQGASWEPRWERMEGVLGAWRAA
jgi:tRNA A37 threonylcarbamoyladenosine biosynthesis protein TsaE